MPSLILEKMEKMKKHKSLLLAEAIPGDWNFAREDTDPVPQPLRPEGPWIPWSEPQRCLDLRFFSPDYVTWLCSEWHN